MTTYIALLRAVNVGGTGKLPMKDLERICGELGLKNVRTYIQSGNVVFETALGEAAIRAKLELALTKAMGRPADVVVRTAGEMRGVLKGNPFPAAEPAKVGVYFQSERVQKCVIKSIVAPGGEEVRLGKRELYIHYPNGMGRSKLKFSAGIGTMRNMNTVAKLVALADE